MSPERLRRRLQFLLERFNDGAPYWSFMVRHAATHRRSSERSARDAFRGLGSATALRQAAAQVWLRQFLLTFVAFVAKLVIEQRLTPSPDASDTERAAD